MWINPGTSQKALRWSSARKAILIAAVALSVRASGDIYLIRGPDLLPSVPWLGGSFECVRGVYRMDGVEIEVYAARRAFPLPVAVETRCGRVSFRRIEADERTLFAFETGGWRVLVVFPKNPADPCRFLGAFHERFAYFDSISTDTLYPPFPAVLKPVGTPVNPVP